MTTENKTIMERIKGIQFNMPVVYKVAGAVTMLAGYLATDVNPVACGSLLYAAGEVSSFKASHDLKLINSGLEKTVDVYHMERA